MCLAHLQETCATANSETLGKSPRSHFSEQAQKSQLAGLQGDNQQRHFHWGARRKSSVRKVHS